MNPAAWASDLTSSIARLRLLVRALGYFRPDAGRIGIAVGLLLVSIGLNLLKPWPLAILVDSVLGSKPYPTWLPGQVQAWAQPGQIIAIIAASLALHLACAAVCAGHVYLSICVGLRGLRRVRDDVFGWLQRLSPTSYGLGTEIRQAEIREKRAVAARRS
jgi:ABC-type multidrug transport system fused ATPase/permease subunit